MIFLKRRFRVEVLPPWMEEIKNEVPGLTTGTGRERDSGARLSHPWPAMPAKPSDHILSHIYVLKCFKYISYT